MRQRHLAWHPAIVWDSGDSLGGTLVYGYSPKWGPVAKDGRVPHFLVGRRIDFRPVELKVR